MKKYYSMILNENETDIYIYGDIVSREWEESDVSGYTLTKELEAVETPLVNVYINSYGGETKEALAIYNALIRHKAEVRTYCDGFACSAASIIFMAGKERVMPTTSLLMIHNAWTYTAGDANGLRKDADELEKVTNASVQAYMTHFNESQEILKLLLDEETWLDAHEALKYGLATSVISEPKINKASQSARKALFLCLQNYQANKKEPPNSEPVNAENKTETLARMLNAIFK